MNILRAEPVSIAAVGDDILKLTMPLSFKGHVGFNGDGARLLGLDRKNVDGTITVSANIRLGVSADWSPTASVTVSHKWNNSPRIEAIHGVFITFENKANDAINDNFKKLPGIISNQLSTIGKPLVL